jgi:hypothetical protein
MTATPLSRARDTHYKTTMKSRIKSFIVDAHCDGWMPASWVRVLFRLFNLRGE